MPDQLEFDLVHPSFASDATVTKLQREAKALYAVAQEKTLLASIEARLNFEQSVFPRPAVDLQELRALVGSRDWQKNHKRYERCAAKNPRSFRASLITLKSLLSFDPQPTK
jgi:hypothetical protein